MVKNIARIFKIIMVGIIVYNIFCSYTYVQAATTYSSMTEQAKGFITAGKSSAANVSVNKITAEFIPIGQILTAIGAGVMVAVTIYMGIKYLTSGPDAQAKLKQQLIGVIVSGMVIFGAYGIWSTALKIASNFDD